MLKSEEGYSLVESLVAMAILLAVLVPSAMFLTFIGNNIFAKEKMEGFIHARNEMEYVLAMKRDSSLTKQVDERWFVRTTVEREGNLREIKVEVFKKDTLSSPTITLETARLWY